MSSTADPSPGVAADGPDLTEAENAVRGWPFAGPSLVRVMAEYDRRGAIEQRAREVAATQADGSGDLDVVDAITGAARYILGESINR